MFAQITSMIKALITFRCYRSVMPTMTLPGSTPLPLSPEDIAYIDGLRAAREKLSTAHVAIGSERLPIWVVYGKGTSDFPGYYLARLFRSRPTPQATSIIVRAPHLDEIRAVLPLELTRLNRRKDDDPNVLEIWV